MGQDTKPMPTSDIPAYRQSLMGGRELTRANVEAAQKVRDLDADTKGLKIPLPAKDINLPVEKKRSATKRPTTRPVASKR